MQVKRICCYCSKYLGVKEVDAVSDEKFNITHGICPECMKKIMAEYEGISSKIQTKTNKTTYWPPK